MASKSTRKSLPIWAKLVIGFGAASFIVIPALFATFFLTVENLVRDSENPVKIAKVAQSIANFPQPLPTGSKYLLGAALGPFSFVTIAMEPEHQEIVIFCNTAMDEPDLQGNLDNAYQFGINIPNTTAKFQKILFKGEETIAGQRMPYIVGRLVESSSKAVATKNPREFEGMVGSLLVKSSHKSVIIYAWQRIGSTFDLSSTMKLLQTIKGF